jgi:hypothetical protein
MRSLTHTDGISGLAVPLMNRMSAGRWTDPLVSSTGWVLGTETGQLLLCGAGYLTEFLGASLGLQSG